MKKVTEEDIEKVLEHIRTKLIQRMEKRSNKPHKNRHETLGKLTEEVYEYTIEVKRQNKKQKEELYDIAETALYGILSLKEKKKDG